jgi:type III secretion system outer membrane ring protein
MKWCKVRGLTVSGKSGYSSIICAATLLLAGMNGRIACAQTHSPGMRDDVVESAPKVVAQRDEFSESSESNAMPGRLSAREGYVAHDAALDQVFEAVAAELGKPIVPSAKARRKKVSGEFDLTYPRSVLERVCADLGLVTYFDGHVIYVYDVSELTNAIGSLRSIDVQTLISFLRESGLYTDTFPINGAAHAHTFYVAGPPVYVDAVLAAARHLDAEERRETEAGDDVVKVIALNHTFVSDRTFNLRDQQIRVPGIATVLADMLGQRSATAAVMPKGIDQAGTDPGTLPDRRPLLPPVPDHLGTVRDTLAPPALAPDPRSMSRVGMPLLAPVAGRPIEVSSRPAVLAYPDTNSLLVKGRREEVQYLSELVEQLDIEKTQIELSLWIIDLSYSSLEQLGIRWQGGLHVNGLGATFNATSGQLSGALSTLDGARFLASVFAMSEQGNAQVVSRPLILTQENVPAIFDNNRTFYAKLIGERTSNLDRITYGTLVSVVPRLSVDHDEIEMILDIEDGDTESSRGVELEVDGLPVVGRTHINTIARVPRELSLLIGGYTRHAEKGENYKIPLLGDIPVVGELFRYRESSGEDVVRVFLIQPKILARRAVWDGEGFREVPRLSSSMTIKQGTALLDEAVRRDRQEKEAAREPEAVQEDEVVQEDEATSKSQPGIEPERSLGTTTQKELAQ